MAIKNISDSTETSSKGELNNSLSQTDCGVRNFMVRDSICDDAANNEACFFDGGDCCLETKESSLCYICLCKLAVPMDDLVEKYEHLGVQKLNNPDKLNTWWPQTLKTIPLVISFEVCSLLCIDNANAWEYNKENDHSCICLMIADVFSFNKHSIQEMDPTPVFPNVTSHQSGVYVATKFQQTLKGI